MSPSPDLVALTPDLDWRLSLEAVFLRPASLGTRPFTFRVLQDAMHDASVVRHAPEILRPFMRDAGYALVCVDLEGTGRETEGAEALEASLEEELAGAGWSGRCAAVVVEPELERWLWCDPRHLPDAIQWPPDGPPIIDWLRQAGMADADPVSIARPKEALQAVLRSVRRPWSSSLFKRLAARVSLVRCSDPAFRRMVHQLSSWFPPSP